MTEINPQSVTSSPVSPKSPRTSLTWLWILLAILLLCPVVVLIAATMWYYSASFENREMANGNSRSEKPPQQLSINLGHATPPVDPPATQIGIGGMGSSSGMGPGGGMGSSGGMGPGDGMASSGGMGGEPGAAINEVRKSVVGLQVTFGELTSRKSVALAVEVVRNGNVVTHLFAPTESLLPVTSKVNGRIVTRSPDVRLEMPQASMETMPGMPPSFPGMGMPPGPGGMYGNSNLEITREIPELGLTVLSMTEYHPSIQIIGEFPQAREGEKLTAIWPNAAGVELTLLATDESVTTSDGRHLKHLLKLTEWKGDPGAVLCNLKGEPIGQIVVAAQTQATGRFCYAASLERAFQAFYQQPSAAQPTTRPKPTGPDAGATALMAVSPAEAIRTDSGDATPAIPDALVPDNQKQLELKSYRVPGFAPDVADTIRALFGDVAKVAVDRAGESIIVAADLPTHERVLLLVAEMKDRAAVRAKELELKAEAEKALEEVKGQAERQQYDEAMKQLERKEQADQDAHRREPRRTRAFKVTDRNPQNVADVLTQLFGKKADIAVDQPSRTVLITINRAETWSEVVFLLSEIEATATKLLSEPVEAGTISEGETGSAGGADSAEIVPSADRDPQSPDATDRAFDQKARDLARKIKSAEHGERDRLRKELEQLTTRHFESRQAQRQREMDELAGRIDKLRMVHSRREQNKTEVIQRRIRDLLDPKSDLNWDSTSAGPLPRPASGAGAGATTPGSTGTASDPAERTTAAETAEISTSLSPESTFDGVPYHQWLKMLETERKPDKLIAAVHACGTLAEEADHHRVARLIFLAMRPYETGDNADWISVWSAGFSELNKLSSGAVVDELIAALKDSETYQNGRGFQARLIAVHASSAINERLDERHEEVVGLLLKLCRQKIPGADWSLVAACELWRRSGRPMSGFAGLQELAEHMIDQGFVGQSPQADIRAKFKSTEIRQEWSLIVQAVVERSPEMPKLALGLVKHVNPDRESLLKLIGKLGRHAEPVVPRLVDMFVESLNRDRKIADLSANAEFAYRRTLLQTLGEIGTGEKGFRLLHQLKLIAPPLDQQFDVVRDFFTTVDEVLARFEGATSSDAGLLLDDKFMLNSRWTLAGPAESSMVMSINDLTARYAETPQSEIWSNEIEIGGMILAETIEIDSAKSPKRISIRHVQNPSNSTTEPDQRLQGIYELTESTLKIQIVPVGHTLPVGLATDSAMVPEGHTLLVFNRESFSKDKLAVK